MNFIVDKWGKRILSIIFFLTIVFMIFGPVKLSFNVNIPFLYFNSTASIAKGIYLKVPARNFHDGDYIVYEPTAATTDLAFDRQWISNKNECFIKQIGAIEGEHYKIDSDTLQFTVNRRYIGQVFTKDREGKSMPALRGDYTVPENEFLPVADNPRSFDGRYTGTVPIKNIKAKVIPLITGFAW
ncbi:S26 family signal peptidase [Pectinatus frisingensis]|uniref:S26 family signal peptidase n=1 Tax=Pectinatus frisingensis TaxID=865 RepID=UPI0018C81303|nr:S26 family signal peptidase [Pectinatus frisingensis]